MQISCGKIQYEGEIDELFLEGGFAKGRVVVLGTIICEDKSKITINSSKIYIMVDIFRLCIQEYHFFSESLPHTIFNISIFLARVNFNNILIISLEVIREKRYEYVHTRPFWRKERKKMREKHNFLNKKNRK